MRPVLIALMSLAIASVAEAGRVTVAAAANVAEPLADVIAGFEEASGHEVELVTGSTGKLYAQIIAGAPFDLFLAADAARPAKLAEEGQTLGAAEPYAIGRLALWARGDDVEQGALTSDYRRLAIADPAVAPYGAAAILALHRLGALAPSQGRLVTGENVAQTFAFVATGNADLGLVALSHVLSPRNRWGEAHWLVPAELHDPIRQDAVLLPGPGDDAAASAFLDYLTGAPGQAVLARFGYDPLP